MRTALSTLTTLIGLLASANCGAADRFIAWLADGEVVSSDRLEAWPMPGSSGRFEDQRLLSPENPGRFLRDRQATIDRSGPVIAMANGDIVTGTIVRFAGNDASGQPPRVSVQLEGLAPVSGSTVDVRAERIVQISSSVEALRLSPLPGSVELSDGRRIAARSVRWKTEGLALLTPEGLVEAPYAEIESASFGGIDVEQAVLEDNYGATAAEDATIFRIQTTGGAILTTSRAMRQEERSRRRGRPTRHVFYYVQPAWADQPIAIPESEIAWCSYRRGDEAPLSLMPAEMLANERLVGRPEPPQLNTNNRSEPLLAGGQQTDLGLVSHAHSEVAFALPEHAASLSIMVGIDQSCSSGGCVRCRIVAEEPTGTTLWGSGILQGSDGLRSTGWLDVAGLSRVILIADYAHDDRPEGADPLDIRDQVAWLSPMVRLDADRLNDSGRKWTTLAGLDDWQLSGDGAKYAEFSSRWNPGIATWDSIVRLRKRQSLVLKRTHRVGVTSDILELRAACPANLEEHQFELNVNGETVAWNTSADRKQLRDWVARYGRSRSREEVDELQLYDRLAYWWDLSPWRGQEVELELTLSGDRESNEIAWRGLSLTSAIANLPATGEPLGSDVPLVSVDSISSHSYRGRGDPVKDGLPGYGRNPPPIRFLGQEHSGGYGLMRDSSITFAVQPDYRKFVALAGCCSQMAGPLQVILDERIVWERPVLTSLDQAEQIEIDIPAGTKTITLTSGANGGYSGLSAFARAGFVTQ